MAIQFNAATLALLESGHVDFRYLASFALDSDTYRFGNHQPGEYLSYDGHLWYGLGGMAQIGQMETRGGLAADQVTLTLDGSLLLDVPEGYDSAQTWLRDVVREDMINRRLEIHEVYQDPETGDVVGGKRMFAGPIDRTPLDLDALRFDIRARSNRQAFGWSNGRTRTDTDQKRVAPDDGSLRHINKVAGSNGSLPWGYVPTKSGQRTGTNPRDAARGALDRLL